MVHYEDIEGYRPFFKDLKRGTIVYSPFVYIEENNGWQQAMVGPGIMTWATKGERWERARRIGFYLDYVDDGNSQTMYYITPEGQLKKATGEYDVLTMDPRRAWRVVDEESQENAGLN